MRNTRDLQVLDLDIEQLKKQRTKEYINSVGERKTRIKEINDSRK
jgi:hypothetical protein